MRERAEKATPGPWGHDDEYVHGQGLLIAEGRGSIAEPDATHIASWHPAVALAVADWLDIEADALATARGHERPAALAVANAYLQETP
jgi:hypothetical protein